MHFETTFYFIIKDIKMIILTFRTLAKIHPLRISGCLANSEGTSLFQFKLDLCWRLKTLVNCKDLVMLCNIR